MANSPGTLFTPPQSKERQMFVHIGSKILMPEDITLREDAEIRLAFEVDLINHQSRDFGLTIELWIDDVENIKFIIGGTLHDIPPFDDLALVALKVAQRVPNRKMFDAVFIAAADWYSRNCEFTLRRGCAGTEDDHVVFEMKPKTHLTTQVHATEPFHREWAQKYFVIP